MFTPLSKGSEQRQHREWEERRLTPGRSYGTAIRPATSSAGPSADPTSPTRRLAQPAPQALRRTARRVDSRESIAEEDGPSGWAWILLRPRRSTVEGWLATWWKRQGVMVVAPCIFAWIWVAIPVPTTESTSTALGALSTLFLRGGAGRGKKEPHEPLPLDVSFLFFLLWYYGVYLAVALIFVTKLFDLYRLNWWPSKLGGIVSYTFFWGASLAFGAAAHYYDLFGIGERRNGREGVGQDDVDWERKTFWIGLTFVTMMAPAVVCFSKLKRDRRHLYRNSLTDLQKAFLERHLIGRIPSSWLRFLWFMAVLGIALFSLIAGQAFASLYLQTLPHTSIDAGVWVYTWVATVTLLNALSAWIISSKIRSRALLFVYKYFFQMVLFTFYRNLFARLRSPQQFATVQLLSSIAVIIIFPLQTTRLWHGALVILLGYDKTYEEHTDIMAIGFYVRGVAQNVTALSFLGWLSILHFGSNSQIYPFFRFSTNDQYTFQLTFLATAVVWASELASAWVARKMMNYIANTNVTQVGLDELREFPELTVACGWTSVHVSCNILLFLVKLNFT